jgi:hypothetical protein
MATMGNGTAYMVAWGLYLLMSVALMFSYERYIAPHIKHRQLRIFIRAVMAIGLFTPGIVSADTVYMAPACVGVVFNILEHSGIGVIKAALPLLFVSFVVFVTLFFWEIRQSGHEHNESERAEPERKAPVFHDDF